MVKMVEQMNDGLLWYSIIRAQTVNESHVYMSYKIHTCTHTRTQALVRYDFKQSTKTASKSRTVSANKKWKQTQMHWNLQAVKYAYSMSLPMSLCSHRKCFFFVFFSLFNTHESYTPQALNTLKRVPIVLFLLLRSFLHANTATKQCYGKTAT